MTEPFDTLLAVQAHDTALDQLRRRLETMPERIALDGLLTRRVSLEAEAATVRKEVEALAERQRALEEQITLTATRRHEIERRMESGQVSAARDLQAMDHEVQQLAARQSRLEEEEMALLEEEEPLDVALAEQESVTAGMAVEQSELERAVASTEAELARAIEETEALRATEASSLPAELADRYERIRARLGGVGAARLVGDRCDGCHLALPSVDVDRIRHLPPAEFATCPQCDRILVH